MAAAYPEFFCFPDHNTKVSTTGGVGLYLICPQKPEVWKFYAAVLMCSRTSFRQKSSIWAVTRPLWKNLGKMPLSVKYRQKKGMKDVHEELKKVKKNGSMLAARETPPALV
ncbi:MAG: hypothetical protein ACLSCR_07790 [Akkermansia sp.]